MIMPVYNREQYLPYAITSVLNQTFRDFELLIVDDGSNDRSRYIIQEYARQDSRIRFFFHKENLGVSAARNTALQIAEGEWIAIIDSDDVWHKERLAKLINILENDVFVSDDILICFDRCGDLIPWETCFQRYHIKFGNNYILEMDLKTYLRKNAPPLRILFPAFVVRDYGLRFPEGCQLDDDLEFYCNLFRLGLRLRLFREALYFYRLTPNSLTARENILKNFAQSEKVFERLLASSYFSDEEKKLLHNLYKKRQQEKIWILFLLSAKQKNIKNMLKCIALFPHTISLYLIKRFPRALAYLFAKLRGANIKW